MAINNIEEFISSGKCKGIDPCTVLLYLAMRHKDWKTVSPKALHILGEELGIDTVMAIPALITLGWMYSLDKNGEVIYALGGWGSSDKSAPTYEWYAHKEPDIKSALLAKALEKKEPIEIKERKRKTKQRPTQDQLDQATAPQIKKAVVQIYREEFENIFASNATFLNVPKNAQVVLNIYKLVDSNLSLFTAYLKFIFEKWEEVKANQPWISCEVPTPGILCSTNFFLAMRKAMNDGFSKPAGGHKGQDGIADRAAQTNWDTEQSGW